LHTSLRHPTFVIDMMRAIYKLVITITLLFAVIYLWQCTSANVRFTSVDQFPEIYPDYVGATIPASMAADNGAMFTIEMQDGRELMVNRHRYGDTIWVEVKAWQEGASEGVAYRPFPMYISHDSIDPYVAYRLIEPGYESWTNISICQRQLASYEESDIVTNRFNGQGCINCHQFAGGNPRQMMFHSRCADGGTVFLEDGNIQKIDFKKLGEGKQATYPAWHPQGRFIAFSSNVTKQCFTVKGEQPIEVYDIASDIILYDRQTGQVYYPPQLNTADVWETFPAWSPDGSSLYYCAADSVGNMPDERGRVHYRLMNIAFNPLSATFADQPTEVALDSIDMTQHSVSFPRINGHWLLFTLTDFGTFPIWHAEADLWLLNLDNGSVRPCDELNSNLTESYHSWSSNGKWIVFSSRRDDGRFTRLYISHFNPVTGTFSKPFMLPQESPRHNRLRIKSYNIPEFIKGKAQPINDTKP